MAHTLRRLRGEYNNIESNNVETMFQPIKFETKKDNEGSGVDYTTRDAFSVTPKSESLNSAGNQNVEPEFRHSVLSNEPVKQSRWKSGCGTADFHSVQNMAEAKKLRKKCCVRNIMRKLTTKRSQNCESLGFNFGLGKYAKKGTKAYVSRQSQIEKDRQHALEQLQNEQKKEQFRLDEAALIKEATSDIIRTSPFETGGKRTQTRKRKQKRSKTSKRKQNKNKKRRSMKKYYYLINNNNNYGPQTFKKIS